MNGKKIAQSLKCPKRCLKSCYQFYSKIEKGGIESNEINNISKDILRMNGYIKKYTDGHVLKIYFYTNLKKILETKNDNEKSCMSQM